MGRRAPDTRRPHRAPPRPLRCSETQPHMYTCTTLWLVSMAWPSLLLSLRSVRVLEQVKILPSDVEKANPRSSWKANVLSLNPPRSISGESSSALIHPPIYLTPSLWFAKTASVASFEDHPNSRSDVSLWTTFISLEGSVSCDCLPDIAQYISPFLHALQRPRTI